MNQFLKQLREHFSSPLSSRQLNSFFNEDASCVRLSTLQTHQPHQYSSQLSRLLNYCRSSGAFAYKLALSALRGFFPPKETVVESFHLQITKVRLLRCVAVT